MAAVANKCSCFNATKVEANVLCSDAYKTMTFKGETFKERTLKNLDCFFNVAGFGCK